MPCETALKSAVLKPDYNPKPVLLPVNVPSMSLDNLPHNTQAHHMDVSIWLHALVDIPENRM